ncbi:exopolysaccharide biosynthesis protein [Bacillus sp. AFS018417]|uniref:exopolysaccharide biosynthesis protein n=1 Tax=Bacillus sp. AFS018417 TaxID=2033491 RepID=UPI0011453926
MLVHWLSPPLEFISVILNQRWKKVRERDAMKQIIISVICFACLILTYIPFKNKKR